MLHSHITAAKNKKVLAGFVDGAAARFCDGYIRCKGSNVPLSVAVLQARLAGFGSNAQENS